MLLELFPTGGRDLVILSGPVVLRGLPLRLQLAVLLEAIQRWKQRSGIHLELSVTQHRESLRDPVAVHRLTREDGENHQIERALRDVELVHRRHLGNLYESV